MRAIAKMVFISIFIGATGANAANKQKDTFFKNSRYKLNVSHERCIDRDSISDYVTVKRDGKKYEIDVVYPFSKYTKSFETFVSDGIAGITIGAEVAEEDESIAENDPESLAACTCMYRLKYKFELGEFINLENPDKVYFVRGKAVQFESK